MSSISRDTLDDILFGAQPEEGAAFGAARFAALEIIHGEPIELGVLDVVAALLLNGFSPIGACEGHAAGGLPYPWVDLLIDERTSRLMTAIARHAARQNEVLLTSLDDEARDFFEMGTKWQLALVPHGSLVRLQSAGAEGIEAWPRERRDFMRTVFVKQMQAFAASLLH